MLIKNSFVTPEQKQHAQEFMTYLLSEEVQSKIAKTNWMLPVRQGTPVPKSFQNLPQPKKTFTLRDAEATVKRWNKAVFR
jgi:ABC-type thiamine transport system substrate-binding protein